VARALSYIPVAQPFYQSRKIATQTLGVAFDEVHAASNTLYSATFEGIHEGAGEHGYDLLTIDESEPFYNTVPNGQWPRGQGWATQIYPYVKDVDVYICPDDTNKCSTTSLSYLWNPNMDNVKNTSPMPRVVSSFTATSMTVALMEGHYIGIGNGMTSFDPSNGALLAGGGGFAIATGSQLYGGYPTYDTGFLGNYTNGTIVGTTCGVSNGYLAVTGRHMDGANYLFADGHVKWLLGSMVSPGTNANKPTDAQGASLDPWNSPSAAGTANSTFEATFSAT